MRRLVGCVSLSLSIAACAPAPSPVRPPPPLPPVVVVVTPPVTSAAPVARPVASIDPSFREHAPAPEPMKPFVPPAATRERLRNGIPVLVVHQPSPFVAIRVVAAGGLVDAGADRAEAVNEMMIALRGGSTRAGSKTLTDPEVRALCVSLGMADPETSWYGDALTVSFVAPVTKLRQAIELAADFTLRPVFAAKDFERWREQDANRADDQANDAVLTANRVLCRMVYGPASCGEGTLTAARTRAVKRSDLLTLHAQVFDASRLSLVVAGGAEEGDVVSALDDAFGAITPTGTGVVRTPAASPAPRLVVVDKPGAPIAAIATDFVGPAFGAPDVEASAVALGVLADASFGRLVKRLHADRNDVAEISLSDSEQRVSGALGWRTRAANDRVAPALAETDRIVRQLAAQGPTEDELRSVRDRDVFAFAGLFQTAPETAREWSWVLAYGRPDESLLGRAQRYAALTSEVVKAAAARYLDADHMHTVVVGDWAALRGPLSALGWGPIEIRSAAGVLLRTEQSRRHP